ncbi:lipopolysaccharide transport periplasmic protein LptA [Desulfurobacterium thermolithotrophum DSM 11699]|uniref:Lipopolysaccharide transport periplasmic protein LptA n=1 Tax=Desulfurobacterium thermolithotrophum (strain DSM 11699 / BSA) TaxID=868864 RepID=F0S0C5_DESTD|nr:lipopolysaccharide transport periplasmic protein LptA [Desulfurobacterium thermolithotrophum]ADY73804.1 lipopolysaccharide transport periplasmic protein LptA [Desulfurobacterium thermolithotrophum DSM 11699]
MRLVVSLLIFFMSISLSALGETKEKTSTPIVIESQKLIYIQKKHMATYIGNVIAQREKTIMKGDKLIVYFDPTDRYIEKIEVIGHVYIKDPRGEGWCNKLYYYPVQEKAVLIGNAKLKQKENLVVGDEIIAYKDGRVTVEGIKQRVKTVIFPEEKNKNLIKGGKESEKSR